MNKKIRVAFIKFGGLAAGSSERRLQTIAVNLPKEEFTVDYYYCDAAPYVGSDYKHIDTDHHRLQFMKDNNINLIKFHVGAKDITTPTHDWINTDFWEKFDSTKYDLVQTVKAGPAEYPYHLLKIPVIELVGLDAGVDFSSNIVWSLHPSQWQRIQWIRKGGKAERSSVIPNPAEPPTTTLNFRSEFGIDSTAIVTGFHQRADNHICSPIPLNSFAKLNNKNWHFFIMGGGAKYRTQAKELKLTNVHFIDHSADATQISKFLNTLDFFAHGRKDGETFGTVLAEAMMHGKPCLSHWSPIANAQPETMGPCGFFAKNENEYTFYLNELFSNESLRKKLAEKTKAHAEQQYSLEAGMQKLALLYKQLVSKTGFQQIQPAKAITYAQSPLGFLYAGELERKDQIASHIVANVIPEEFDVHIVKYFLPFIKNFIDIGANTGLYGFIAAHENKNMVVHCFEPQETCCATMKQTIYLNNWESRVFVHQLGIGAKQETLTFHLSGTGSSFNHNFVGKELLPIISVHVETLDDQIAALNLAAIDFIKIDVEGFEKEVLIGAQKTLALHHPILFIEIAQKINERDYTNHNYQATIEKLRAYGYKIFEVSSNNTLRDVNFLKEHNGVSMFLCLHETKHAAHIPAIKRWAQFYRSNKRKELYLHRIKKLLKIVFNPYQNFPKIYSRVFNDFAKK